MSFLTTPASVVRCLLRDIGDPAAGACYARRIAQAAHFNPWSDPGTEETYREAAERLEALAAERAAEKQRQEER